MTLKIYDSIGREYDEDAIAKIREEIERRPLRCTVTDLVAEGPLVGIDPQLNYQWEWPNYKGPICGPTRKTMLAAAAEERMREMFVFGRTGRVWDHWWHVLAGISKRARSAN